MTTLIAAPKLGTALLIGSFVLGQLVSSRSSTAAGSSATPTGP
jgi:hypothetical protein